MSSDKTPDKAAKKGCFKSAIFGIGCGCLYPAATMLILTLVFIFLLAEPLRLIVTTTTLPEFAGPDQESFWSLQQKRLDLETLASPSLELTPSEFNAYLSACQLRPMNGFCLQRIRFAPGAKSGHFYFIGSGFLLRNLVFQVEAVKTGLQIMPGKLKINSWLVPDNGFLRGYLIKYLRSLPEAGPDSTISRYLAGKSSFDFSESLITLTGQF